MPLPQGSSTHNLQRLARAHEARLERQLVDPARLRDGAGPDGQAVTISTPISRRSLGALLGVPLR